VCEDTISASRECSRMSTKGNRIHSSKKSLALFYNSLIICASLPFPPTHDLFIITTNIFQFSSSSNGQYTTPREFPNTPTILQSTSPTTVFPLTLQKFPPLNVDMDNASQEPLRLNRLRQDSGNVSLPRGVEVGEVENWGFAAWLYWFNYL